MEDIHDIKPPVPVGIDPLIIKAVIVFSIIILCLISGYLLFTYLKNRLNKKDKSDLIALPPPLPPDQAALLELEIVSGLMITDPRLYYFRLTALVKTFIGKVFNINAPEMTTQEIVSALNNLAIDKVIEKKMLSKAKEFFISASMVKYAAVIPQLDQMKSDEVFVREFIANVSF